MLLENQAVTFITLPSRCLKKKIIKNLKIYSQKVVSAFQTLSVVNVANITVFSLKIHKNQVKSAPFEFNLLISFVLRRYPDLLKQSL